MPCMLLKLLECERLLWVQAAYKAVVSENFADVAHLGGGVYGEHTHSTQTYLAHSDGAPVVHMSFHWVHTISKECIFHAMQDGTRQTYPSLVNMICRMLVRVQYLKFLVLFSLRAGTSLFCCRNSGILACNCIVFCQFHTSIALLMV